MADDWILVDAPAQSIFSVLADPSQYEVFVVGNSQIRRFDPRWPQPGTRFHHLLGVKPLVVAGSSLSLATDYETYLVLETGMGILGATLTTFYLMETPDGTKLEVREEPWSGLVARFWSKAVDIALDRRNRLLLRRLKRLSEEQFTRERSVLPGPGSGEGGDPADQGTPAEPMA